MTWWALACACTFLVLTVVIGWALAGNLRWGFIGGARLVALATHLHVALVGWVLIVMVGVGHRLLPMFLLSHGANERPGKAAVALLATGVALLFALHHVPAAAVRWLPATLILAGVVAFLAQARAFYRHEASSGTRSRGCAWPVPLSRSWAPRSPSASTCSPRDSPGRGSRPRTSSSWCWASACSWPPTTTRSCRSWSGITASAPWRGGSPSRRSPSSIRHAGRPPRASFSRSAPRRSAAGVGFGVAGMARGGAALLAIGSAILAAQMVALARRRPDPTVTAATAVVPLPESDPPFSHGVRIP